LNYALRAMVCRGNQAGLLPALANREPSVDEIGENYCIFITELRQTKVRNASEADQPRIFINPEITARSTETGTIYEGCGSVSGPGSFGAVSRPKEITVSAWDELGRKFELRCDGLLARAIQHECDHLDGILAVSRAMDKFSFALRSQKKL